MAYMAYKDHNANYCTRLAGNVCILLVLSLFIFVSLEVGYKEEWSY